MKNRSLTGIIAVLASVACLIAGCNRNVDDGVESDRISDTPKTEQSAADTLVPPMPETTEAVTTEAVTTETVTTEVVTEVVTETETVAPETETEPLVTEAVTELPVVTPDPEPTPPAPTVPIPKPVIDLSGEAIRGGEAVKGQLVSAQSPYIRLLVDYEFLWQENNDYVLTLNVGLSYYELWCSERASGGTITVDGVSRSFASPAISHEAHEEAYTAFFTQTYNCTGNTLASIDVAWAFNGTYGGEKIGTLSTGAILQWAEPGSTPPPVDSPAETEPFPAPETEITPEPIPDPAPAPETDPVPVPETDPLPETETDSLPDVTPDPAPETEPTPATEPDPLLPDANENTES